MFLMARLDVLPFVIAIDIVIFLVAIWDLMTTAGANSFKAERNLHADRIVAKTTTRQTDSVLHGTTAAVDLGS